MHRDLLSFLLVEVLLETAPCYRGNCSVVRPSVSADVRVMLATSRVQMVQIKQDDYSPNVIATMVGEVEPETIVVVGAHYDSRGVQRSSATAAAPGANDDGSGTQLLLQLARLIFEDGISFKYTLVLGAWSGEEQGRFTPALR